MFVNKRRVGRCRKNTAMVTGTEVKVLELVPLQGQP